METVHNYATPTFNFLKALNDTRNALAHGSRVKLMRVRNEDCHYPINEPNADTNLSS